MIKLSNGPRVCRSITNVKGTSIADVRIGNKIATRHFNQIWKRSPPIDIIDEVEDQSDAPDETGQPSAGRSHPSSLPDLQAPNSTARSNSAGEMQQPKEPASCPRRQCRNDVNYETLASLRSYR
ncbi:hypothetical protein WN48_09693 [Eufriesea mexicana]|uniref:Uncharacterized protein n=1 Tax=Eufriesea mexicana TaxID=516756 RepID=A0A310SSQ9_9HYME|nr:hypothetical protein WN48_09693 [Eufriesea mexicana]